MKHVMRAETFGQLLLAQVEMCYSAAVVLTRDPNKARKLTREAVTQIWHLRNGADDSVGLRQNLMAALRDLYKLNETDDMPREVDRVSST